MKKREGKLCFGMGNQAFVDGAIAAGARFYAGYPITPSTEMAEYSSELLPKVGGVFVQMEDELGSMAALVGASCAGKKVYTATSGPGFSLMQEPLGIAIAIEVPCVIVDVERIGPGTGNVSGPSQGDFYQARWGTHGDYSIIAVSPASVQECYDLAIYAFNLAEKFRTPVIVLMDAHTGHLHETYFKWIPSEDDIFNRVEPDCDPGEFQTASLDGGIDSVAPMSKFGSKYIQHYNGATHDVYGDGCLQPDNIETLTNHYVNKIESHRKEITKTRKFMLDDAEYVIVAFGISVRGAVAAMKKARAKGLKVGVLQVMTVWPFPNEEFEDYAGKVKAVFVPELNHGQMAAQLKTVLDPSVQIHSICKTNSEIIGPNEILSKIEEVTAK